jgi:filamentous hemagglutinin family protein
MNRNRYRLVFNELSGCWVPVAETVAARGKRSTGRVRRTVLAAACALGFSGSLLAAGNLPVAARNFVDARLPGTATLAQTANSMVVKQTGNAVMLNWNSFNIARGSSVHFDQSSAAMRAINVVAPGGPRSEINGALTAKGQVFLFNQAGILFGANAQVDVGGLVGSTLKLNDELLARALNSLGSQGPALSKFTDADRAGLATGDITVAAGARIVAAKNGRVLLAAPNVTNAGHISAEEGQVVLAAGEKIYIADPLDSRLRGFLVEVDQGGKVTTEAASEMLSDRGNITLVGLNIRHAGAARATTSVTLNGTVYLKARDNISALDRDEIFPDAAPLATGQSVPIGQRTGRVELAAGSVIEVRPDDATADARIRDDVLFRKSEVNLYGREIVLEDAAASGSGAAIHAPSGVLRMTARRDGGVDSHPSVLPRVYLGRGTDIDLSGVDARADADREIVRVELRGNEVKDSPLLRDAEYGKALFGKEMWVDARKGTQLVDVSGYVGGIERTVGEKSVEGGQFVVVSDGDMRTHSASHIDLSGGTVTYGAGTVNYSQVRSADGRTQAVEDALADRVYTGVADRTRELAQIVEGRDAGQMTVSAPGMALDGRITATRTVGVTQRAPGRRWVSPGVSQTIGVPQAGRLFLSLLNTDRPQSVRFVNGTESRTLGQGSALPDELWLRSDLFSAGGIGSFVLTGAGKVTLPADVALDITSTALRDSTTGKWSNGSRFSVSATSFVLDGDINAAGGKVTLSTDAPNEGLSLAQRSVRFGADASISTAGRWMTDTRDTLGTYIATDGGSIVIDARGDLLLPAGSRLDVSAGARRALDGRISLGNAGSLSLLAGSRIDGASGVAGSFGDFYGMLTLGGELSGYAVSRLGKVGGSGTLTLRSAEVVIDGSATHNAAGSLYLAPALFSGRGFDDITIEGGNGVAIGHADGSSFRLAPQVTVRQLSVLPQGGLASLSGVGSVDALAREFRSDGINLSFKALSNTSGEVVLHRGATVAVDAGGSITLTGNRSVAVAGTLTAPGGSITLDQDLPRTVDTRDGDNYTGASVFVAPTARLDVSGSFVARPDLPYVDGTVFDGGDITLAARRGYLVIQDGAELRADGSSAVLRQRDGSSLVDTRIDSNGGHIALSAREGLYVDPLLSAKAGGSTAVGGSLSVRLAQEGFPWLDLQSLPAALSGPRVLDITQAGASGSAAFSAGAVPDAARHAGHGAFALNRLAGSGIVDLELGAVGATSHGAVRFASDVTQTLAGRLDIDAANLLGASGADVTLRAAVIDWHNVGRDQKDHAQATSVAPGDGTLDLRADLLSVSGNLAASGFSAVNMGARGDLRASAAPAYFASGATLSTSGNLTLTAAQLYPTSGSKYAFEVQNNAAGVLTVLHSGSQSGVAYSALGELTLAAPTIRQGGRVVAPLGSIRLLSQNISRTGAGAASVTRTGAAGGAVELAAGSVTSVSAAGMQLPFGQTTLSGKEWNYVIGALDILPLTATPQAGVTLNADNVLLRGADGGKAAARVDLSGGGDLQAWEWIPGTGGSADVLSAAKTSDSYAIVPALRNAYAPYDTSIYAEDVHGLRAGDAITLLSDVNGVAAGTYALLPARYALLPGAYLVKVAAGDQSILAGQSSRMPDGSVRVAARDARITSNGTASGGKNYVARLYSAEQVGKLAEYKLSDTGDVFSDGRSTQDAARLSLQVGSRLQLDGVLDTSHAATARGAQVDIAARALAVLGGGATARSGEVGIAFERLNALNAESLVLGGTRNGTDPETGVTQLDLRDTGSDGLALYGAKTVRVDTRSGAAGAGLNGPDIVIAARESVVLEEGSSVSASGGAHADALTLVGSGAAADGALLRVGSGELALPQRDAPAGQKGVLTLGSGARISGRSVVLDSTLNTENRGAVIKLPAADGTLALTGSTISVGEVTGNEGGLIFGNEALAALGNPSGLTLKSYGSLNLYGTVTLGSNALDRLTIDAIGIGGYRNAGKAQRIVARNIVLSDSRPLPSAASAFAAGTGNGVLTVSAQTVSFGNTPQASGSAAGFAVRGFDQVRIDASRGVVMSGKGQYAVDSAVRIDTPKISAATGASVELTATGALTLTGRGGVPGTDAGVGGALSLRAQTIAVQTLIDMPSGRISAAADGDVTLGVLPDGAGSGRIVAAGVLRDYLGRKVATPGGTVSLASANGNVVVQSGASIDVSAAADGGDAGAVSLSAPQGTVSVADGSLKAASTGGAAGGEFVVDAKAIASLDGMAAVSADFTRRWVARVRTGDTRLDGAIKAQEISIGTDAGSLTVAGLLDASGPDKGGRIDLSARRASSYANGLASGVGDVVLAAGARLDARATTHVATAEGTAGEGGSVVIEASPFAAGGESGSAKGGTVRIADGALIDVGTQAKTEGGVTVASAARKGEVTLRSERRNNSSVAIAGDLGKAITGAGNVFIEGTRIYGGSTLSMTTANTHSNAFVTTANVAALRTVLGLPAANQKGATQYHIRPQVEFRATGDFTIAATDLAANTYLGGTEAGTLTVRAPGTLTVSGTLSDGFGKAKSGAVTNLLGALTSTGLTATSYFDLGTRDTAWALRLTSGADTAASNAMALRSLGTLEAEGKGDLVVAANAQVRTGAGTIDVAAGRDLKLAGAKSAIYTAGYQDARGTAFDVSTQLSIGTPGNRRAEYAMNGGDISVVAQRTVSAPESTQSAGSWLFRQGALADDGTLIASTSAGSLRNPTWYARIDQFDQGIATFGGGDITLRAGAGIRNVGVSTATSGRLFGDGGSLPDAKNLKVLGGGDIVVSAGGDIGSATFYVDRGHLLAQAGGAFASARQNGAGSVLLLGDASARLQAAGDIKVETVSSATMVQQLAASRTGGRESYFISYGADNRVDILSYGGSATLKNSAVPWGTGSLALWSGTRPLLPASLTLVAMGGDANVGNGMVLLPSTYNDLLLAARGSLNLATASGGASQIKIADIAPSNLPYIVRPAVTVNDLLLGRLLGTALVSGSYAHDAALNEARVVTPVRLVAENGDIDVPFGGSDLLLALYSPQPVLVDAGGDITNLTIRSQHFGADDVSRIRAGGNITFSAVQTAGVPSGNVAEGIQVGGRGKLEVIAGGSIDLANSFGIVTRGNFDNPALAEQGASILVQAGSRQFGASELLALLRPVTGSGLSIEPFDRIIVEVSGAGSIAQFLTPSASDDAKTQQLKTKVAALREVEQKRIATVVDRIDEAIVSWMRTQPGHAGAGDAALIAAFDALPANERGAFFDANRPLLSGLLNASLRYAGQLGDLLGTGKESFRPGYEAIAAAFPVPAAGDINLFASQIKSEQGGNVDLAAPGGAINVGVAGSGASAVAASRQGVFAIGAGEINALSGADFQVGPSRVFTMGGGDIQIWSSGGNIDAGKGSSTASATPPPQVVIRGDLVVLDISASVSGSGVRTLAKSPDIDLSATEIRVFAPDGAVIAQDAGFGGSNIFIAAREVIGDNIKGSVSGSATVAPAAPAAPAVAPPSEANKATDQAQGSTASGNREERERNSILTVELVGLGETATGAGDIPAGEGGSGGAGDGTAPGEGKRKDRDTRVN